MSHQSVGRFYFKEVTGDVVVLNIPGTNYLLTLRATAPVEPSPQGRVRGVIRLPVWKLDEISAGGAFIEPVYGRPRRVQGSVMGVERATNSVIVDLHGQPIVGDLPPRWRASELVIGSRVGLDVKEGGVFEPLPAIANLEPDPRGQISINLAVA